MKKTKGFTLIELMITVVIITILASIAVPSYQNYITKSKIKATQSSLITLSVVVESIFQRKLSYPAADLTDTAAILNDSAFKAWAPTDNDFDYSYTAPTATETYSVTATGVAGKVSGCELILSGDGTRTVNNCSLAAGWAN